MGWDLSYIMFMQFMDLSATTVVLPSDAEFISREKRGWLSGNAPDSVSRFGWW